MVAAGDVAPIWRKDIINHHDKIGQLHIYHRAYIIFAKLSSGISYFAENNNVVPVSLKETFVFWIHIVITDDKSVLFKKWLGAVRHQTITTLPEPMLTTVRDIILRRHASINCIQDRPQSISAILTQPHCVDISFACTYEEKPVNPLCPSLITDHAEVL